MRTLASCRCPSFQEYRITFRLHPTNNRVVDVGMDCAVPDSASLAFPSPLGTDGQVVEEIAKESAVFVFSRGAGGLIEREDLNHCALPDKTRRDLISLMNPSCSIDLRSQSPYKGTICRLSKHVRPTRPVRIRTDLAEAVSLSSL